MGRIISLKFRSNGTASASTTRSRWAFSTIFRFLLVVAFLILAAVTTQVQKHAFTSSAFPERNTAGYEFPSIQSYSGVPHNTLLGREKSNIITREEKDIMDDNDGVRRGSGGEGKGSDMITTREEDAIDKDNADDEKEISRSRIRKENHAAEVVQDSVQNRRNEVFASAPNIESQAQKRQAWYDQLDTQNQPYPELDYAPQRIPGYLNNSGRALFGFVMRDLTTRIMSRAIAHSNILVVSSDAPGVVRLLQSEKLGVKTEEDLRRQVNHTVGGSTLIHAKSQQHAFFGLYDGLAATSEYDARDTVDGWWQQLGEYSTEPRPSWFLMMLIDSLKSDEVLRQAQRLLRESTVTYIVASFGCDKKFQHFGMDAIEYLLDQKYKVQLLSISHAPDDIYRPNLEITKAYLPVFFRLLARLSQLYQQPIRGYVFATQGLDLAIPLASEYLEKVTRDNIDYRQCPQSQTEVRFVHQQGGDDETGSIRIKCHTGPPQRIVPITDDDLNNQLSNDTSIWYDGENLKESEAVCVSKATCQPMASLNLRTAAQIDAAKVGCRTRTLPKQSTADSDPKGSALYKNHQPPNLLLLMIDPISRPRFERSLAKTNALLSQLKFTSFDSYTAVGNNSGPNQAALYSGQPLKSRDSISNHTREWLWDTLRKEGGYATLKAEDGCIENSNMIQSIQPRVDHGSSFNKMMCFDFQRPNCLGGKRAAEHLVQYGIQFMSAYSKLEKPWAAFLHFIDSHEDTQTLEGTLDDILMKLLFDIYKTSNIRLQKGLKSKIPSTAWNNTIIVLMSDHGMHYGPSFSAAGILERAQPILHVHLPSTVASPNKVEALTHNENLITTPFDVYETILDLLLPKTPDFRRPGSYGSSLLRRLPEERKSCASVPVIPPGACELIGGASSRKGNRLMIPNPPSALSFYADIHADNKPSLETLGEQNLTFHLFHESCQCATDRRPWYNCSVHPWSDEEMADNELSILLEMFVMIDCPDAQRVEIQVKPDPQILNRSYVTKAQESGLALARPNILWIEVDSVSRAYADRHFPKTRELLNKYRLRSLQTRDREESTSTPVYECNSTKWCSAEFSQLAVVGPNSIPNQIAAFSGCFVTTLAENCEDINQEEAGFFCNENAHPVYGMQLVGRFRGAQTWCRRPEDLTQKQPSPWLFDVTNASGYVNLFAEEFCYDGSPYVAQGQMFHLSADLLPHKLFCRDIERKMLRKDGKIGSHLWHFKGSSDPNTPGIDGKNSYPKANVSLDAIRSMFEAYKTIPKFAYVNAMAAHIYSQYTTMTLAAEAYDILLAEFLTEFLEEATNTIILVRSDHGLQGGGQTRDYAVQIEAFRPWTEVILPRTFPEKSLDNLYKNQDRLVTGHDLYRTIATAAIAGESTNMPAPGDWAIDFLDTEIPESRTCADARVPADYCIYEDERSFSTPNFGTCNLAESDQSFLCPTSAKDFEAALATDVTAFFGTEQVEAHACPDASWSNSPVKDSIQQLWKMIDTQVSLHPSARVSGGIFLYPRQTSLLISLVELLAEVTKAKEGRSLTLCETGFGAGHSAAMFLEASPSISVYSFDKFDRPYQEEIASKLETFYPGRMKHVKGDSCLTVPDNLAPGGDTGSGVRCDVLHGSSLCKTDNIDLVERSPCGVLLTTTAMNSLTDDVVYFGPNGQWTNLKSRNCITDVTCFSEEERVLGKDYIFNKNGATISHKFCIAVTTGNCQRHTARGKAIGLQEAACERDFASITKNHLRLSQICKAHQVSVPS